MLQIPAIMTLLGAFVTNEGILIASDSALTDPTGGSPPSMAQKIHPCGQGIVVGLVGRAGWTFPQVPSDVDAQKLVADACAKAEPRASVYGQAQSLSALLLATANETYPREYRAAIPEGIFQTLVVAGYMNGSALILQTQIRVRPSTSEFELTEWQNHGNTCGIVAGKQGAADALLHQRRDLLPPDLVGRPEVTAMLRPDCQFSSAEALAFFGFAINVSRDFAPKFGFTAAEVNWPIDYALITETQVSPVKRIDDLVR